MEERKNKIDMNTMEKKYLNSLPKREKVHLSSIEDAFKSIQKQELNKIKERKQNKIAD
jgi:restriction endonuclease